MKRLITFLTLALLIQAGLSFAGDLDNYYLEQFGEEQTTGEAQKSAKESVQPHCGMPIRRSLGQDWPKLESSTQRTLAKYLQQPVLNGEATYTSSGGHFIIHYATIGTDAPPLNATPPSVTPDWVITVADTFEYVYSQEVTAYGYTPPPNFPYNIYLSQLGPQSTFGITQADSPASGQSAPSYIEIDNDFLELIFQNSIPGNESTAAKALKALQITAAHEFHHAIQFGYNYFFESWYAEATSTWMEDEVYDNVNQLYDYSVAYLLNPSMPLDTSVSLSTGGGYGRWIFNRYLTENNGSGIIHSIWTKLQQTTATGNSDIPMLPIIDKTLADSSGSLATESLRFAKRLYKQDWTTHTSDLADIYQHPLALSGTYNYYPVNFSSNPSPSVTLPKNYSMAFFKFLPAPTAPQDLHLSFSQKPDTLSVVAIKKLVNGSFEEFALDAATSSITIKDFNASSTKEAVLIIDNISNRDLQTAVFSTDGTTPPPSGGGGGGGGCFIATAAYGSYLHPKVVVLRKFRDNYLLTNEPGRIFVRLYYRYSPPVAELLRQNSSAKLLVRTALVPLVFVAEHLIHIVYAAIFMIAIVTGLGIKRRIRRPGAVGCMTN